MLKVYEGVVTWPNLMIINPHRYDCDYNDYYCH